MKTFIQLLLAGILGGTIAFGAFKYFDTDTIIYESSPSPAVYPTKSTATIATPHDDFVLAAEKANPAVVHIKAENEAYRRYGASRQQYDPFEDFWGFRRQRGERPQAGTGSGVLIRDNGYIVTNNHVVGFADYIEVTLHDGVKYQAKKIGTDPSTDLAVIKIEGPLFPYLEMEDSDEVKVGQWVVAVGNPFNLASTVTAGIVSAIGRDLDIIKGFKSIEEFIQTDAVVNPGNSGGALVNANGELIGINTAISSPTGVYAGYSFAIPSNLVTKVIDEIMKTGGDIQRAILGITMAEINEVRENSNIRIKEDKGVYVANFLVDDYGRKIAESSAEHAGIEIGDVIVGVEDNVINTTSDLSEALKFAKIGETLDVTVVRNGRKKTIPVKLRRGI